MFHPHEINWDNDKISSLWNYYSKNSYFTQSYFTKVYGLYIINYLSKKVELTGKELLDYGSGPGFILEHLLKLKIPIQYSALDFSEISIQFLKKKYYRETVFRNAYYVDKFPTHINNKFDLVLCCEVIEHLNDEKLSEMVSEIKSLLKGDGYVFFSTPNDEDLEALKHICPECGCIFHKWQHVRSWNKLTLKTFMEMNGFETIFIEEVVLANAVNKVKFVTKRIIDNKIKKPNLLYLGKLRQL